MQVAVADSQLTKLQADLHVINLAAGAELPAEFRSVPGAADAEGGFRKLAMLRPERPERLLVIGIGEAKELDREKLRILAALVEKQSRRYEAKRIAWDLRGLKRPGAEEAVAAVTEGLVMAAFRFDRYRAQKPDDEPAPTLERLELALDEAGEEASEAAARALVASEAANRVRTLQTLPANELTPTALADRAAELADGYERVAIRVLDGGEIAERGLGGLAAVGAGATEEPKLITLRYEGRGGGETLGLVGKAVTFDSGGISIKPAAAMHEMKMDMSGGAAVLEAVAAIAELGLDLDIVAAIPATENMPSGSAMRPGDVITQLNGKTVEVTNTDAEGRLILADALTWCVREQGADRIVDLATLTGATLVGLGSTYAALIANDDDLAAQVTRAAERSGELAWRLPLHPEYKKLTEGTITDLINSSAKRKAGTIYAASFLEEFVDGRPWAHLDIAGTAWDVGREYVGAGPTGFGVRLLVELARSLSSK
ncbi:MAG: leucyl aminopeptidase [Actinomycetota bacterium]|nr:leucyl aminopeptidase [Actinomycetota bacterium]